MKIEYGVCSPYLEVAEKNLPLHFHIVIEEIPYPVLTLHNGMGRCVRAEVTHKVRTNGVGESYCIPDDVYSFEKGAKIALQRALDNTTLSDAHRIKIWEGFCHFLP